MVWNFKIHKPVQNKQNNPSPQKTQNKLGIQVKTGSFFPLLDELGNCLHFEICKDSQGVTMKAGIFTC